MSVSKEKSLHIIKADTIPYIDISFFILWKLDLFCLLEKISPSLLSKRTINSCMPTQTKPNLLVLVMKQELLCS